MNRIALLIIAALLTLPSISVATPKRTISVSGTSQTRIVPDTIVWTVTVSTHDPKLTEAKNKSDAQIRGILKTTKELGAPEHCLQTGYFNVGKEYERGPDGRRNIFKHFTITRTVTIKATDTSRFDDYLTALVKNTDMQVSYRLETTKLETVRWDTRLKAVAVAKKKALAMAKVLGSTIGKPLSINESVGHSGRSNISNDYNFAEGIDLNSQSGTFAPGSIPISVTVGVVFELE